jgi:hypothetical protein
MSNTLSPELQKQIEQEAETYAQVRFDETWHKKGLHRKTLLRYAHMDGAKSIADKLAAAEQLIEQMAKALGAIAYPIRYLQEEAKKEGSQLNGQYAFEIADNPSWLRSKATAALTDYNNYKKGKDGK